MPALLLMIMGLAIVSSAGRRTARRQKPPSATSRTRRLYDEITRVMGVRNPPRLIFDQGVGNAQADGTSIRVSPWWVSEVLRTHCADAMCHVTFLAGVLAHELGHHVLGHIGGLGCVVDPHGCELEADAYAATALARLGIEPSDFAAIISRLSAHGSDTHPAGRRREQVITRVYRFERGRVIAIRVAG